MERKTLIGDEARKHLTDALEYISHAVGSTMGPGGRPFGFDKIGTDQRMMASFSKDGLTVLRSLFFDDPSWQAVLQYCKQASAHSVLASGDGPQPMYSKILTPKGFVSMEDAYVGMKICGTNGTIQEITGIFPKGEKEIYEVEFANKGVVECCSDHLWTVINTGTLYNKKETKTTQQLLSDYSSIMTCGKLRSRYYTPNTEVEFYTNTEEMPLDPYLVGVLLGDGSLSGTGSIEISIGLKKEHILKKLILPDGIYSSVNYCEDKNYFRVKLNGRNTNSGRNIADDLRSLGLFGTKSKTKFIPKSYLYSSLGNRKALLQGLIDTDGHINKKGLFEFSSVSKEMAQDFADLCRSLGKTVSVSKLDRKEGSSYSMTSIYRVTELKGYKYGDKITRIAPTGKITKMQCIKVSNPDNLYITDNYVVTHNTTSTIVLASSVAKAVMQSGAKFPQAYAREIEADARRAADMIRKESFKGDEVVKLVALTSTNGDEELVDVVLEAISKSSAHGTIIVEKNPASRQRYKITRQDGYSNCHGYNYNSTFALSASDNAASSKPIEWEKPLIVLFNGSLVSYETQLKPITSAWKEQRNLVIFAYEVGDQVSNELMILNRKMAGLGWPQRVFVVRPRYTAEVNSVLQVMRDFAAYCGIDDSKIIDGGNIKSVDESFFGTCGKIRISQGSTAILGRAENHWVEKRILQNKSIMEEARSDFDREMTSIRSAELAEGLVRVEVGDGLLPDLQERADRFDDASRAAQSCMLHGALPGCGSSYIRAATIASVHPDLAQAMRAVHNTVLENYGVVPKDTFMPPAGMGAALVDGNCLIGPALELRVLDAAETVAAVITNGVGLGVKIATMGGFSFRTSQDNE